MHWLYCILPLASAVSGTLNLQTFRPSLSDRLTQSVPRSDTNIQKRQTTPKFLNDQTKKFSVNGTGIPEVDFDVGESYAGLLPIGDANDTNQLYFWFFPSTNDAAANKEILIWLTGGPGCSSTGELLQENGPFLWQPGVFKPVENQWSWHKLTNVVWVDSPIGAGFSKGTVTARDENDVAQQFMGFWKNFVDTFSMQGYKVYVTGSSYSGMYSPYIASAMLDANDTAYFNVSGMQIFDGIYSSDVLAEDIPTASFVDEWSSVFSFNDSFSQIVRNATTSCGYQDYLSKYLAYPAAGVQPTQLPGLQDDGSYLTGCDVLNAVFAGAVETNPCFSPYTITNHCPLPYDPLGFSDGTFFSPSGSGPAYFDRPDVKAAINAPGDVDWVFCSDDPVFVDGTDLSLSLAAGPGGSQAQLARVVDATHNVILGHGSLDFVLPAAGALLTIQNLTFGGRLGFEERPSAPLYVPYSGLDTADAESMTGAGVLGTAHTERGLTYFGVAASGHFLSMDAPGVAFRSVEVLLGRVDGFQSRAPFTTDRDATPQPNLPMGNGTVLVGLVNGQEAERGDETIAAVAMAAAATSSGGAKAIASSGVGFLALLLFVQGSWSVFL